MAPKNKQNKKKTETEKPQNMKAQPWIQMRTGIILMVITSVAMAVLTAWQSIPAVGTVDGILYGLLFGGLIWAIFFGNILINRFLRK